VPIRALGEARRNFNVRVKSRRARGLILKELLVAAEFSTEGIVDCATLLRATRRRELTRSRAVSAAARSRAAAEAPRRRRRRSAPHVSARAFDGPATQVVVERRGAFELLLISSTFDTFQREMSR